MEDVVVDGAVVRGDDVHEVHVGVSLLQSAVTAVQGCCGDGEAEQGPPHTHPLTSHTREHEPQRSSGLIQPLQHNTIIIINFGIVVSKSRENATPRPYRQGGDIELNRYW